MDQKVALSQQQPEDWLGYFVEQNALPQFNTLAPSPTLAIKEEDPVVDQQSPIEQGEGQQQQQPHLEQDLTFTGQGTDSKPRKKTVRSPAKNKKKKAATTQKRVGGISAKGKREKKKKAAEKRKRKGNALGQKGIVYKAGNSKKRLTHLVL